MDLYLYRSLQEISKRHVRRCAAVALLVSQFESLNRQQGLSPVTRGGIFQQVPTNQLTDQATEGQFPLRACAGIVAFSVMNREKAFHMNHECNVNRNRDLFFDCCCGFLLSWIHSCACSRSGSRRLRVKETPRWIESSRTAVLLWARVSATAPNMQHMLLVGWFLCLG